MIKDDIFIYESPTHEWIAIGGFAHVLEVECDVCGMKVSTDDGWVYFKGTHMDICKTNARCRGGGIGRHARLKT